jgi:pilus assembly protein TadC
MGAALPWALAVVSCALAAAGLVRAPGRRLRRLGAEAERIPVVPPPVWAQTGREPGIGGVLRGRLDAPPLWRRALVSVGAAAAGLVPLSTLIEWRGFAPWLLLLPPLAAAGTVGLGLLEPVATRRRERRLVLDTPVALELLAGCLAAGLPPRGATAAVVEVLEGPVVDDLRSVLLAIDVGLSDAMAWRTLRGHPQLGEAAVDLAQSVESGTRMVETLSYYAREARQRRLAAIEVTAKAIGVRCVLPMMACFLPAFVLLGIVPTVVSAFLHALPRFF